ncbi:MAG: DUF1295 domain-containing protein [Anaerolineales bacterium]|nr:DUF1295 domain-containing protein [Anaerolineales bacterium]
MALIPTFRLGLWNAWIPMMIFVLIPFLATVLYPDMSKKMRHPFDMKMIPIVKRMDSLYSFLFPMAMICSIFLPLQIGTLWFIFGIAIYSLGMVVMVAALRSFANAEVDEIVTSGIYKYSRHPMYLSLFLGLSGIGLASGSWIFLLISFVIFGIANIIAAHEENYRREKHGVEYYEYSRRTPRWLGFPK